MGKYLIHYKQRAIKDLTPLWPLYFTGFHFHQSPGQRFWVPVELFPGDWIGFLVSIFVLRHVAFSSNCTWPMFSISDLGFRNVIKGARPLFTVYWYLVTGGMAAMATWYWILDSRWHSDRSETLLIEYCASSIEHQGSPDTNGKWQEASDYNPVTSIQQRTTRNPAIWFRKFYRRHLPGQVKYN